MPAAAQSAPGKADMCVERPGLTTNECVIDAGHVQIETGLIDWTLDKHGSGRTDTILAADSLVRIGIGDATEVRIGWTPFGYQRERQAGMIDKVSGVGDVTVGLKRTIIDAKKHGDVGLSFAVIPYATLPAGRYPIGAGTWSAGAQLPLGWRIDKALKFELTPIVQAAANDDGHGRHLRYSAAFGAKYNLSETVSIQTEIQAERDDDPDRSVRGTSVVAGPSIGAQVSSHCQLDLGANFGLNRHTPDAEVYAGVTWLL